MKHTSRFLTAVAIAMLVAVPSVFAQTTPEASLLPVTEPLDVGGTILQPGTYTIRVVPSFVNRNKIQILSQDGEKVFATVLTVPHELEPGEEMENTTFVYYPAGEGAPRALRTWFASDPPGRHGHDIVYGEDRAKQLARLARSRVISYGNEVAEADFGTTTLHVITPEATVETYTYTPPAPMISNTTADVEMPATASNVPMLALLGLLSLVGAVAVRAFRV